LKKEVNSFADYMADETRVTPIEKEKINFEVELIGKMIEVREKKASVSFDDIKQDLMMDEKFKEEYEKIKPEYEVMSRIISKTDIPEND